MLKSCCGGRTRFAEIMKPERGERREEILQEEEREEKRAAKKTTPSREKRSPLVPTQPYQIPIPPKFPFCTAASSLVFPTPA